MMKSVLLSLALCVGGSSFSQLPNGSVAPDFTLTDYYGTTTHNLYSYLNAGKTVFVEIFAAHCPGCWSYHQTNRLQDLYNMYGPSGTDEVMVLALEHDEYNDSTAFTGNHDPWVTQGDWLTGTPYPIFNVEWPDRGVFDDYNVTYYPVVYKICPDKLTELISTNASVSQLYQKVQACAPLSTPDLSDVGNVYIDQYTGNLMIDRYELVTSMKVLNLQGQVVISTGALNSNSIDIGSPTTGVYICQIETENGVVARKFFVR